MWATDASYFRVVGWGYYYMVTVMDDYSRSILTWKLPLDMTADSLIQVASCRLLHSGDSLAAAKTAASSGELSLFRGIRVLAVELSCFPCSSRARHR